MFVFLKGRKRDNFKSNEEEKRKKRKKKKE